MSSCAMIKAACAQPRAGGASRKIRRRATKMLGGEGGIRTPDTVTRMPHLECGAFNHSATSPWPHRCKHPMGRRLCNQRETAKQERSVARRKWFIVALDRADTQKNLARSPARRHILPEPADDQVGDL